MEMAIRRLGCVRGSPCPPDLCLAEIREGEWAVLGLLGGQPEGLGSDMV